VHVGCVLSDIFDDVRCASTVQRDTSEDYQRFLPSAIEQLTSHMLSVCSSPADCISRLSGFVELTLHYTTPDFRCRHRQHECDGGIGRGERSV